MSQRSRWLELLARGATALALVGLGLLAAQVGIGSAAADRLDPELQWAVDRLQILDLIARYPHAADGLAPEAYAGLFTADGEFRGDYDPTGAGELAHASGRAELIEFAKHSMGPRRGEAQPRHYRLDTVFLEQTPDRAHTRTYLLETVAIHNLPPYLFATGVYDEEIVKTPDGWRFRRITLDVDSLRPPLDEIRADVAEYLRQHPEEARAIQRQQPTPE